MLIWERVFRTRASPPAQMPWRQEAILWASLCVLLDFTAFPKLPEQFVAIGNRIAQKKEIDPMCCSHALKFNEMNSLCFTVITFSCSKQVPWVVCSSLSFYISFAQWTLWSTVRKSPSLVIWVYISYVKSELIWFFRETDDLLFTSELCWYTVCEEGKFKIFCA